MNRTATLRRALLRWYRGHRRDLPWRRTRDPYRIWISEIMLQQTRVDSVIPYYEAFVRRFPRVEDLARAPADSVLRAWAGLGYYRRARLLHAAARRIVADHDGRLPHDPEALRALPGIGDYTAGAIGSIAFDLPLPIVDGNVVRVFSRWDALDGDVAGSALRRRFVAMARDWAATRHPGEANQALMELGALVCTKATPQCAHCPVTAHCRAHARGLQHTLPRPRRRRATRGVTLAAALLRRGGRLLLIEREAPGLLHGWWEVPLVESAADAAALAAALRRDLRCTARTWLPVARVRHGVLHHRLDVSVWRGTTPRQRPCAGRRVAGDAPRGLGNLHAGARWRWVHADACGGLPLTTLTRKALRAAARVDPSWQRYLREQPGDGAAGERRRHPPQQHAK